MSDIYVLADKVASSMPDNPPRIRDARREQLRSVVHHARARLLLDLVELPVSLEVLDYLNRMANAELELGEQCQRTASAILDELEGKV